MSTFTPFGGQPVKNNGFTVLNGNPTDTEISNDIDYSQLSNSQVVQGAISGYTQTVLGGEFGQYESIVVAGYTERLAGSANDAVKDLDYHTNVDGARNYQRIDIDSINILTGEITYGANNGVTVPVSGQDGTTGVNADHAISQVPAELVYRDGSPNPIQDEYNN